MPPRAIFMFYNTFLQHKAWEPLSKTRFLQSHSVRLRSNFVTTPERCAPFRDNQRALFPIRDNPGANGSNSWQPGGPWPSIRDNHGALFPIRDSPRGLFNLTCRPGKPAITPCLEIIIVHPWKASEMMPDDYCVTKTSYCENKKHFFISNHRRFSFIFNPLWKPLSWDWLWSSLSCTLLEIFGRPCPPKRKQGAPQFLVGIRRRIAYGQPFYIRCSGVWQISGYALCERLHRFRFRTCRTDPESRPHLRQSHLSQFRRDQQWRHGGLPDIQRMQVFPYRQFRQPRGHSPLRRCLLHDLN